MSDAEKSKPAPGEKAAKPKAPLSFRFAVFMMMVTALVFLPTSIVLSVCMMPTLVAAIVDNQPQKTAWLTVGAMNFAGAVPACFNLWDAGHTVPAAFQMITQPMTVVVSFGGAAVGWMIYYNITPLVALMLLRRSEGRLTDIDKRQKELVKKWGPEVAS